MNRIESQVLRLKQLIDNAKADYPISELQRPSAGWLRAFRQALGLSLKSVAERLNVSPQAIHQFEKSEAVGSISIRQLEAVAGAMGCRVVYTLVPRQGTLGDLANAGKDKAPAAVQHSMSLEGQTVELPEKLP